jgi:hypothetical protein
VRATAVLIAIAAVGLTAGMVLGHLAATVWPRAALGLAVCAFAVAALITGRATCP